MKYNFNKNKINSYILSLSIIFFLSINFIYFTLNLNVDLEVYAFNELFVNYQAGFIRRGLLGEIFWQLYNKFSIDPKFFFSFFFFIIYLAQILLFFSLFKRYIVSKTVFILIMLSPSFLLFHIYSPDLYFIKDSIIKFVFILHAYIFYNFFFIKKDKEMYLKYLKFLIIPILFAVILTHEYQVFSLSLHFLISIGTSNRKEDIKKIFIYYSPLILPVLLVILFMGNQTQFENLNNILKVFNVELNDYLGGGVYKYIGSFYKWHFFYFSYDDFLSLFFSFILSALIIYILFQYFIEKKIITFQSKYQNRYLLYFLPVLIPFLLTSDHGRNLAFLSFYLISFYLILNLNQVQFIRQVNTIYKNILVKNLIFIFIFFFIFMWKLDQFAGFELQGKPNGIFKSSLFAEFIKLIKFLYIYIDINIIDLPEIKL